MNPEEITPDNALTVLIQTLRETPLWEKDPNVRICCTMIGGKLIDLQYRIDTAVAALRPENPF
jgi:hypothetical protein